MMITLNIKTRPINLQPIKQALIKSAIDIESDAKRNITNNGNVRTGRLRASITYALSDMRSEFTPANPASGYQAENPRESDRIKKPEFDMIAKIGTNVEYAPHIEFGTIHSGQGGIWSFLRRAYYGQRSNIIKRFHDALEEGVKG